MVETCFESYQVKAGYRDGVVLVRVPPEDFWSGVVILSEGDKLTGTFEARQKGEAPRKTMEVSRPRGKAPAVLVDVVLYRHDVLLENDEQSCDATWEVISINATPTDAEIPMAPETLMANHFEISGGTATNLSDSQFVKKLRESFLYWGDKAMIEQGE